MHRHSRHTSALTRILSHSLTLFHIRTPFPSMFTLSLSIHAHSHTHEHAQSHYTAHSTQHTPKAINVDRRTSISLWISVLSSATALCISFRISARSSSTSAAVPFQPPMIPSYARSRDGERITCTAYDAEEIQKIADSETHTHTQKETYPACGQCGRPRRRHSVRVNAPEVCRGSKGREIIERFTAYLCLVVCFHGANFGDLYLHVFKLFAHKVVDVLTFGSGSHDDAAQVSKKFRNTFCMEFTASFTFLCSFSKV